MPERRGSEGKSGGSHLPGSSRRAAAVGKVDHAGLGAPLEYHRTGRVVPGAGRAEACQHPHFGLRSGGHFEPRADEFGDSPRVFRVERAQCLIVPLNGRRRSAGARHLGNRDVRRFALNLHCPLPQRIQQYRQSGDRPHRRCTSRATHLPERRGLGARRSIRRHRSCFCAAVRICGLPREHRVQLAFPREPPGFRQIERWNEFALHVFGPKLFCREILHVWSPHPASIPGIGEPPAAPRPADTG
ncbi:hypothetical protein ebA5064 [Aromatoleum aromaticum EbN1]|uniref:Uncharacterized protein n=1 Tax=Aromatoleum aromaticum (strain DSM 19018 / LMG 30748 / EbN1) TaxID=76114 RepID=Q5P120_AROAE|nr:hypothetical protein ebA5064 [Aromatoleum aromaticum EbN1]